jgi:CubicO group peptidase (beta-lactamase class C family)
VWETPAYSNAAFRILGYIAANVSNMTTAGALKTSIIGPLGLNNTYTARPSDYKGVIPGTGSLWDMELGEDMP